MIISTLEANTLAIPFKGAFHHASASRNETATLWVEARTADGKSGFGEGCPRDYVTSETLASAFRFFADHRADWLSSIHDVDTLRAWSDGHAAQIDANPAAWSAVELALLDLAGKVANRPVEALLGLPCLEGSFRYTAVLGDMPAPMFEAQLARYVHAGFRDFKVKLASDPARNLAKVTALRKADIPPTSVRADANNLWRESAAAITDLAALDFPFFALEEPLAAGDYAGLKRVSRALATRIILDESALRADQLASLGDADDRWICNVRVSKMGGLLRSLDVIDEARRRGVGVIIGAHVGETSLLTRAALTAAMHASDILIAQEGAFGTHLLTTDIVARPIMFGAGARLDASALRVGELAGFGLPITPPVKYLEAPPVSR